MLTALFLCHLVFSSVLVADNPDVLYRVNQSRDQHVASFESFKSNGYYPIYICMHEANGQILFDQIWEKSSANPAWQLRIGLSDTEYEVQNKKWTDGGMKRFASCNLSVDGHMKHSAIWQNGYDFVETKSYIGKTNDEHTQIYRDLRSTMMPIYVKSTRFGNEVRVDSVWQKRNANWETHNSMSDQYYEQKKSDLSQLGFKLLWHYERTDSGNKYHDAVWCK